MINIQDYPWYLQQPDPNINSPFVTVYDRLFDLVSEASPLGVGDAFNLEELSGEALGQFGSMWGLSGTTGYYSGLIYDWDEWNMGKVWSGQITDVDSQFYRKYLKAKAYMNGRNYSLNTLWEVFQIILGGYGSWSITVYEPSSTLSVGIIKNIDNDQTVDINDLTVGMKVELVPDVHSNTGRLIVKVTGISGNVITTDLGELNKTSKVFNYTKPMSFIIVLQASESIIEFFQQMLSYDNGFLGKLSGISYKFEYIKRGA